MHPMDAAVHLGPDWVLQFKVDLQYPCPEVALYQRVPPLCLLSKKSKGGGSHDKVRIIIFPMSHGQHAAGLYALGFSIR